MIAWNHGRFSGESTPPDAGVPYPSLLDRLLIRGSTQAPRLWKMVAHLPISPNPARHSTPASHPLTEADHALNYDPQHLDTSRE
ncbi:hypothetical protein FRC11_014601 [Ceratobasidium sp. 423]|nr:hypothetical protein FRC11_014601 [Ceratobasidium sp. 423]